MRIAGHEVGRLGLGGGHIPGCRDDAEAARLLRRALALGIRLIDTADLYGDGAGETRIAAALHPYPSELVIVTKGGFVQGRDGPLPDGRPAHLRAACEASLRRLRMDCIALYLLHTPDPAVPLEESLGALDDLRAAGKIRHAGVSNVDAEELRRARAATPIECVQNIFNVRRYRRFGADAVLAACERDSLPFIAYGPLATGDERTSEVAARRGMPPAQVALAWLLQHSPVTVPIPGTTSVAHLEENLAAANVRLEEDELAELERRPHVPKATTGIEPV